MSEPEREELIDALLDQLRGHGEELPEALRSGSLTG
jgi:hypothetical protein